MNKLLNKLYFFKLEISSVWYSALARFICMLRGIKLGTHCKFYGSSLFFKSPQSKIEIGHKVVFRSSSQSNLIGVNRRCAISAHDSAVVKIGNNCGFSGTVIGAFSFISIGNNVKCGANTLITDSDWHPEDARAGENRPIHIGNNVWIGEGVKILKGVTIGDNALIGSGSVVTKDIPANTIAAGNPCVVKREL